MTDQPFHMWSYWRDKYTSEATVLQDYYSDTLKADPELQAAVTQIKTAEAFIEQRMAALAADPQDFGRD